MFSPRTPVRRALSILGDLLIAGFVFAATVGSYRDLVAGHGDLRFLAAMAASAPLLLRRRYPLAVLGVIEAATAAHMFLFDAFLRGNGFGLAVAVATVATRRERSETLRIAAGLVFVNSLLIATLGHLNWTDIGGNLVFNLVLISGSWAAGDNIRTRRAYLAQLEERALRLEREREENASRAVTDERGRIARELHDVVAHHVSAIAVQAGAASEIALRDPPGALKALTAIQDTSREALREMRAIVGVLGSDNGSALRPQPGLSDVPGLVQRISDSGVAVSLSVRGEKAAPLPATVDLTAFRIVQEALTNVLKHAPNAHARVIVAHSEEAVEVTVEDDGPGSDAGGSPPGHGLIGMRERVGLFGGSLEAANGASGFRVHARLPLEGEAR